MSAKPRKKRRAPRQPRDLSDRERKFVQALIGEAAGNATQAARIAGFGNGGKNGHAWQQRGHELLKRPRVRAEYERQLELVAQMQREAEELVRRQTLAKIAKERAEQLVGPISTAIDLQRWWTRVYLGEIEGVTMADRMRASELLGKALGVFNHPVRLNLNLGEVDDDELLNEYLRAREERSREERDAIDVEALPAGDGEGDLESSERPTEDTLEEGSDAA